MIQWAAVMTCLSPIRVPEKQINIKDRQNENKGTAQDKDQNKAKYYDKDGGKPFLYKNKNKN